VPHSFEIPAPLPSSILDEILSNSKDETILLPQDESSSDFPYEEPQTFSQSELNDLVRDLGLSKDAAKLLGSRLKIKTRKEDRMRIC